MQVKSKQKKTVPNMAAYMRGMTCLIAPEQNFFATRGGSILVEAKRYVRGLRRKPVKVLFPENEAEFKSGVFKTAPPSQTAAQNVKSKRDVKPAASVKQCAEGNSVKAKSKFHSLENDPSFTATGGDSDGLRFERAYPGDKRLG